MSVINQTDGARTEVQAGEWCVDGLLSDSCAAVDGPIERLVTSCADQLVVALPDHFSPRRNGPLGEFPAQGGGAWPVETQEGSVLVRATGSGKWSSASWAFDLARTDEC